MPRPKSTRKSPRASRAREKSPENGNQRGQKRRRILSETIPNEEILKKIKETKHDIFCWTCHQLCEDDNLCNTCPRVYHSECLNANTFGSENLCPECQFESLDGTKLPPTLTVNKLNNLIKHAHNKVRWKEPDLYQWIDEKEFTEQLIKPMDLEVLEDNLNHQHLNYISTGEFYSDVKWIYHNCVIVYGPNHAKTKCSIRILKQFKTELLDIEACYKCYERATKNDVNFFTVVCEENHKLIWAKIKGYSYWPSKCLKVIDGIADVRFFGTHDKGTAQVASCYELSQMHPTGKNLKHALYVSALSELEIYLNNWRSKYGIFQYARPLTKFHASEMNFCTRKVIGKRSKKKRKRGNPNERIINNNEQNAEVIEVSETEDPTNQSSSDIEISEDNHSYETSLISVDQRRAHESEDNDSTRNLPEDNSLNDNLQIHTSNTSNSGLEIVSVALTNSPNMAICIEPTSIITIPPNQTENNASFQRHDLNQHPNYMQSNSPGVIYNNIHASTSYSSQRHVSSNDTSSQENITENLNSSPALNSSTQVSTSHDNNTYQKILDMAIQANLHRNYRAIYMNAILMRKDFEKLISLLEQKLDNQSNNQDDANKNVMQGEQPSTSYSNLQNDIEFKDKNLHEHLTEINKDIPVESDTSEKKNIQFDELEKKDKKIEELLRKNKEYEEMIINQRKEIENLKKEDPSENCSSTNNYLEGEQSSSSHSQETQNKDDDNK